MVNENKDHWLEKVNTHLESLLEKAKRDTDLQRKMGKYYCRRYQITRAKLKTVRARIEALTHHEEKNNLYILVEASIHS